MDGRTVRIDSERLFVLSSAIRARACVRGILYTTATVAVGRTVGPAVVHQGRVGQVGSGSGIIPTSPLARPRPHACLYVCLSVCPSVGCQSVGFPPCVSERNVG